MKYNNAFFHTYMTFMCVSFLYFFGGTFSSVLGAEVARPLGVEDDQLNMEELLSELFEGLSPEEQEKVLAEAKVLGEAIENMSPEERKQLEDELENLFAGEEELPIVSKKDTKPKKESPSEEKKIPEVPKKPLLTEKEQQAEKEVLTLLESLINRTNSFIKKAASMPLLADETEEWRKEKKIDVWPSDISWKKFKTQIEEIIKQLYTVKSYDVQTKEYKYIGDLVANKSLHTHLIKLQKTLNLHESSIEISAFGLKKISPESKQALQKVINGYSHALYTGNIAQEFDRVIEKYEPKAKKIKEVEEHAKEKAEKEAKKVQAPGKIVVSREEKQYAPLYRGRKAIDKNDDYEIEYPYGIGRVPRYPYAKEKKEAAKVKPMAKSQKDAREKLKETKKPVLPAQERKDPESEQIIGRITATMKTIDELIRENQTMGTIQEHMLNEAEPVKLDLAIVVIPTLKRKIAEVTGDIKALSYNVKSFFSATKQYYKNEIDRITLPYNETLQKLSVQIKTLKKNMEDKEFSKKISPEKRYAYLEDYTTGEIIKKGKGTEEKTILDEVPNPVSLYLLQEAIDTLMKEKELFLKPKEKKTS